MIERSTAGGVLALLLLLFQLGAATPVRGADREGWSKDERAVLATLHLASLPGALPDPSNAVEQLPAAAALGKRLFFDTRFSSNGKVACASCHLPERQFQDDRPVGQGVATGLRRTMPITAGAHQKWFFWDGRKDSMWSQALGPLEDPAEHGGNRLAYAKLIQRHYRQDYEALFRAMPALDRLPDNAGPNGTPAERAAWNGLGEAARQDVSRIFANMGKAIAAYEVTLRHGPSRLDRYIDAVLNGQAAGGLLADAEKRGLRLFMGKAQCITCHGGALLSDQHFHNTGVPGAPGQAPSEGRALAIEKVLRDEFNCLGAFSDAPPRACRELRFIASGDPHMVGAFKTPGLRNVAQRAPYMHAGQLATLTDVVRHYAAAPPSAKGQNERRPMALSEQDVADLVGFLHTLSGTVLEGRAP